MGQKPLVSMLLIATMGLPLSACTLGGSDAPDTIEPEAAQMAARIEGLGTRTRYPIILAHGFDASPTNRWGFYKVAEALRSAGHTVIVAQVPPYQSPEVRADYLAGYVDTALSGGASKVNIIAHSMGGLDARYLISSLGYGDVVASLTTISTPHRGSLVADVALGLLDIASCDTAINAVASAWGLTYSDVAYDSDVRAALAGISESNAAWWNADNPNDSRVYYQSWAGVSSVAGISNFQDKDACEYKLPSGPADVMNATLVPMATFVAHGIRFLPNDGMVMVESAKWGNFRGCIPADHLDEVGQLRHDSADPRTGFNHLKFYLGIASDLAAQGF